MNDKRDRVEPEGEELPPSPDANFQDQKSRSPTEKLKVHNEEEKQDPTPNQQSQQSIDMEVHHHGHVHEKKKWKEYVFQFLMLFLAVFCGFLAEYQLEHKIEKDRELQFMQSLYADLQDDVAGLEVLIAIEHNSLRQFDTLITLLNDPKLARENGDQLYYLARLGPRAKPFANNSRTFDQLRNSGGFRLITNRAASNNITGYYNKFSLVRLLENNYDLEFDNYKKIAARILDPVILRRQETEAGDILLSTDNPSLQTYDAAILKELSYHALQMSGSRRSRIGMLQDLKKTAVELRQSLHSHYALDNE